jgi:hypothetical protein
LRESPRGVPGRCARHPLSDASGAPHVRDAGARAGPVLHLLGRPRVDGPGNIVACGATAAWLLGLGEVGPEPYEFSCAERRQTHRSNVILNKRSYQPSEVTVVCGVPVTTPTRTVLDLAASDEDPSLVANVLTDALPGLSPGDCEVLAGRLDELKRSPRRGGVRCPTHSDAGRVMNWSSATQRSSTAPSRGQFASLESTRETATVRCSGTGSSAACSPAVRGASSSRAEAACSHASPTPVPRATSTSPRRGGKLCFKQRNEQNHGHGRAGGIPNDKAFGTVAVVPFRIPATVTLLEASEDGRGKIVAAWKYVSAGRRAAQAHDPGDIVNPIAVEGFGRHLGGPDTSGPPLY